MTPYDVGLLILRLVLGLTLAAHGLNKFFGGGKIPGTARWFESIGMKPGKFHATVAASTETAAGLGLAAGLLTPIPAAGFVSLMIVAAWTVHRANGFFIVKEGWEYNLVLGGQPPSPWPRWVPASSAWTTSSSARTIGSTAGTGYCCRQGWVSPGPSASC